MKGDLYRTVLNEETLQMGLEAQVPDKVELITQREDFYGLVICSKGQVETLKMLSPIIQILETEILMNGSVLVSSNYGIYQEWRFVPLPADAEEAAQPPDAASVKARWG